MPSRILEDDVSEQPRGDDEDQGRPDAGRHDGNETDDIRAQITQRDPGSGPQRRAGGSVEEKVIDANRNRTGEASGERVRAWQKLRQDQVPQPMRSESLLGAPDQGVRIQGEPAQDTEYSGAVKAPQH